MSWPAPVDRSTAAPERTSTAAVVSVGMAIAPYLLWFQAIQLGATDTSDILILVGFALCVGAIVFGCVGIHHTGHPSVVGRWIAVTGLVLGALPLIAVILVMAAYAQSGGTN